MNEAPQRLHYFMIAGTVLYSVKTPEGEVPQSVPANAIVRHTDMAFPVYKISKAQQNLIKAFSMKLPDDAKENIALGDVVVTNISYLGHMTEEEFQQPDPALAEYEAAQKAAAIVPEAV